MEVHVDRDAFMRGLQMAHNVVEPRQTLPVLANVLLEAQGDTLRMTATDLEVSVRVTGPAKVVKPGTITISARKLMEIVKELPSAPLALEGAGERLGRAPLRGGVVPAGRAHPGGVSRGGGWRDHRLADDRRQGPARHAGPDDLRDLPRREPLCPERRAVRGAGQGAADGGHRRASAGPGGAPAPGRGAGDVRASFRARRSRRSRGSWGPARKWRSRSATTSS